MIILHKVIEPPVIYADCVKFTMHNSGFGVDYVHRNLEEFNQWQWNSLENTSNSV
jgi:hypothetical protein